jgi:uncharacterized protein
MIIDFHTHIFSSGVKQDRDKYLSDPLFNQLFASPKAKIATADDLITNMDKSNVDLSVVLNISWANSQRCIESNNNIMEAVNRFPKKLVGFGAVNPWEMDISAKEIERCAKNGLKGIGEIRLERQLFNPENSYLLDGFMNALIDDKMMLLLHCSEPVGHQYPGKGDTTPEMIYRLITRYPEITLICAHWGGGLPFYTLMPEVKQSLTNVMFDTAASPFLYSPVIYRQVLELIGDEKILFGTDYPLIEQSRCVKDVLALQLPEEKAEKILSQNARYLLGLTA